ncbi:MAG: branched-chain amino acid ABC transporter substrate-binding protein, partial [Treponema sp.]|nr:branched-chain amino acid ABC transporter substrate-binding protein [Treponema sp.]
MKKRFILAGVLFLAALTVLSAGGAKENTIKIGFNIPLTGDSPKVGEGAKYAAELVLKDVNAAGGLDV